MIPGVNGECEGPCGESPEGSRSDGRFRWHRRIVLGFMCFMRAHFITNPSQGIFWAPSKHHPDISGGSEGGMKVGGVKQVSPNKVESTTGTL